jgi:hypothetical protein
MGDAISALVRLLARQAARDAFSCLPLESQIGDNEGEGHL